LSGAGLVPFAASGNLNDANNGFSFVQAHFKVAQPATHTSTGTTTINVDTVAQTVSYKSSFDFHLDLTISEVTPGSFHPDLNGSVFIPADGLDPLTATLSTSFAFADASGILDGSITPKIDQSVESRTRALGADINGDDNNDFVTFSSLDINYLTEDEISFDLGAAGSTIDDIAGAIRAAFANTVGPIVLNGTIAIDALNVQFLGNVNPDFSVALAGAVGPSAVPLPPALWLFGAAIVTLGAWRRRATTSVH
jgi:hypothetical protein